jgi:hypothetical protein
MSVSSHHPVDSPSVHMYPYRLRTPHLRHSPPEACRPRCTWSPAPTKTTRRACPCSACSLRGLYMLPSNRRSAETRSDLPHCKCNSTPPPADSLACARTDLLLSATRPVQSGAILDARGSPSTPFCIFPGKRPPSTWAKLEPRHVHAPARASAPFARFARFWDFRSPNQRDPWPSVDLQLQAPCRPLSVSL